MHSQIFYVKTKDVPDIRFRLAGYPAIFSNPVPAKTVPGTGYLSQIVLGPFWQLVELKFTQRMGAILQNSWST